MGICTYPDLILVAILYNTMNRYAVLFLTLVVLVTTGVFFNLTTSSANADLVAHWKLDETTSGGEDSVVDSAGNSHGTPVGSDGLNNKPQPSSSVPEVSFDNPRSLDFDGTDDYVLTTFTEELEDFTVCLWFYSDGAEVAYERLLDKSHSGGFWLGRNDNNANSWGGGVKEGAPNYGRYVTLPDGQWNHLCSVRSGTTHTIIGNGGVVSTSGTVNGDPITAAPLYIGVRSDLQRYFDGKIDDVRIYNRALSAGEISELAGVFPISENFDSAQPEKWILKGNASWGATVDGQRTLRLTTAATSQAGLGYYDTAFSSDSGIVVEFEYYAGGGTGADGITFFLVDGDEVNVGNIEPGAFGSSLGYALSGSTPGVPHAYLGIGFDEYGGFVLAGGGKTGIGSSVPDNVTLRGSGNGTSGYDYLTHTDVSAEPINQTIDGGWRTARITVSPESESATVRVEMSWNGGETWYTIIDDYEYDEVPPDFLKLGFTAGTGGSTNIHAIDNLNVSIPADLAVAVTDAPDGAYLYGDTVEYTYTVTNNGPNTAGDVTVTNNINIGPIGFSDVSWSYTTTSGGSGSGDESDIDSFVVNINDSEVVTVTVQATLGSAVHAESDLNHTIAAIPQSGYIDPSPSSAEAIIEITAGHSWDDDLTAYWRLDEGSGSIAYDSTGNGNDGTVSGASYTGDIPESIEFENRHSLSFDGENDVVTTTFNPVYTDGDSFTWLLWFKTDTNQTGRGLFSARDTSKAGNPLAEIYLASGEIQGLFRGANGQRRDLKYTTNYADNEWHNVAIVIDNGDGTMYVDGVARASITDLDMNINLGDVFIPIGSSNYENSVQRYFTGSIDDVRVYERALSSAEVLSVYLGYENPQDDIDDPIISDVATSLVSSSEATITWTTDENASSKVTYGPSTSYGTTTTEINTSPRITSHEVPLSGLLACTTYHFVVVSTDGSSNTATSTDNNFTTTGCEGDAIPNQTTSTFIHAGNTGTASLTVEAKTFAVTANAPVGTSLVMQVKAIPGITVLNSLGRPSTAPNEVGVTVFDVKAIVNGDTIFESFDAEVTIDYEYSDEEVSQLDESSLWLYHYTGGEWVALNDCSLDMDANTISCTTPSFSVFGLFANESIETEGSIGNSTARGVHFGCKDTKALNYNYFSAHRQELCEYETLSQALLRIVNQYRDLLMQAYSSGISLPQNILNLLGVASPIQTVRDLEYGMEGDDVTALQKLLITQGYNIPAGATGYFGKQTQYALDAYQVANGVAPRGGYFGPITRGQMKMVELEELWW